MVTNLWCTPNDDSAETETSWAQRQTVGFINETATAQQLPTRRSNWLIHTTTTPLSRCPLTADDRVEQSYTQVTQSTEAVQKRLVGLLDLGETPFHPLFLSSPHPLAMTRHDRSIVRKVMWTQWEILQAKIAGETIYIKCKILFR